MRNEEKSSRSDCRDCGAKISHFVRNDKKCWFQTNLSIDDKIEHGLLIQEVFEDSPAWEAGLRAGDEVIQFGSIRIRTGGDILLAIDGQPVEHAETVSKILKSHVIDDTITLTIHRAGEEIELIVTLSERPVPNS